MVSIRPFKKSDNEQILAMEKLCPQGDENYALITDKSPDASARYKLYDNYHFLVAEEAGKVGGSIGWTVKESFKGNLYIYLVEVNVHPDFRRQGIASQLVNEVEKHAAYIGADHIYCYIYEPNKSSKALFTKHGYVNPIYFKSCALSVYKNVNILKRFEVESIKMNEIQGVVDLINHYYEKRGHFTPYTPESFESFVNGIPGYGLKNFRVVKEKGKIVACAGLWDSSALASYYFSKEPLSMKAAYMIFKILNKFTKMSRIPGEGEYFKLYYLVDHAFKTKNTDAISALTGYLNNQILEAKGEFLVANLDPDDILLEVHSFPNVEKWSLFAKALGRESVDFNQIYIDIRDCIG